MLVSRIVPNAETALDQPDVVGPGGRIPVTDRSNHAIAIDKERPRQLTPVSALAAGASRQRGVQPTPPHPRVRERDKRCLVQIERAIEMVVGIAESRYVAEPILVEPAVRLGRRLHVNERDLRSERTQIRTDTCDVRERLTAERSTEVAKEDEQQRAAIRQRPNRARHLYFVTTADCAHFSSLRASS